MRVYRLDEKSLNDLKYFLRLDGYQKIINHIDALEKELEVLYEIVNEQEQEIKRIKRGSGC